MLYFVVFQFKLKVWVIGIIFLIAPGVYAFTAPIFGYLGDRKVCTMYSNIAECNQNFSMEQMSGE